MGNQLKQFPAYALAECGELQERSQPCSMPGPCEWRPQTCACTDNSGSHFFNDDDVLLERLEASKHGDQLLTKLHVNVALFSTTAVDIVEGLLQMTRQQLTWKCGEELSLYHSLHEGLQHHARPPVHLMKTLQWVYRVEEMPAAAAAPARQCVLLFFSTMLAAAAALKWQRSPPAVWKQKGYEADEVLRSVEARFSEVIAGLRFLGCVALLQHCAEPSLLGSKKTMKALLEATGVEVSGNKSSFWKHMDGAATPKFDLAGTANGGRGVGYLRHHPDSPNLLLKADASWDLFFHEARRRPTDAAVQLLRDLQGGVHDGSVFELGRGSPVAGSGPSRFSPPLMPQAAYVGMDTWDDELVYCPSGQGKGDSDVAAAPWARSAREDFFGDDSEGVHIVVPL